MGFNAPVLLDDAFIKPHTFIDSLCSLFNEALGDGSFQ